MATSLIPPRALSLPGPPPRLPERVERAVREQQDAGEALIGWIQLAVVLTFAALYAISPKTFAADAPFQPVPWAIGIYFLFTVARLALAYRIRLPAWLLTLSILIDMALLFGLIWSFHLQYGQPPSFYLKVPTLLYVFIFIALRALRFEAKYVIFAGIAAALGWLAMVLYVVFVDPDNSMVTRNYVQYLTSNSILLGAEFDKIISMLVVTAILALAITRARALLTRAVAEGAAARDLSRFFSPEIAQRITGAETEIAAGQGELRDTAILMLDIRGFTRYAASIPPAEVIGMLAEYQARMVPIIRAHGGSVDKFLGDGIMATFGAAQPSQRYAADAISALLACLAEAKDWATERERAGLAPLPVNGAVATGRIVFGAVGDSARLEYTVIGDAVNLAAKLEKHNKRAGSRGLATAEAVALAEAQGWRPIWEARPLPGSRLTDLERPVDLVAVA
ncbi:MAG: cyaA [Rhodospirillales bacterium]|nr:cyaA [Rhodospirillales bacterium]